MHDGDDHTIDDLLEGLEGTARTERAELVRWLFEQGITAEEIRATNPPLLLATRHIIGDDGTYVSTREISETHGIDLGLLQRVQRAIGLVRVDDPDAAVHMRADGEAAAFTQRFVELGLDPEHVILVVGCSPKVCRGPPRSCGTRRFRRSCARAPASSKSPKPQRLW